MLTVNPHFSRSPPGAACLLLMPLPATQCRQQPRYGRCAGRCSFISCFVVQLVLKIRGVRTSSAMSRISSLVSLMFSALASPQISGARRPASSSIELVGLVRSGSRADILARQKPGWVFVDCGPPDHHLEDIEVPSPLGGNLFARTLVLEVPAVLLEHTVAPTSAHLVAKRRHLWTSTTWK